MKKRAIKRMRKIINGDMGTPRKVTRSEGLPCPNCGGDKINLTKHEVTGRLLRDEAIQAWVCSDPHCQVIPYAVVAAIDLAVDSPTIRGDIERLTLGEGIGVDECELYVECEGLDTGWSYRGVAECINVAIDGKANKIEYRIAVKVTEYLRDYHNYLLCLASTGKASELLAQSIASVIAHRDRQ